MVLGCSSGVLEGDLYTEITGYGIYTSEVVKTFKDESITSGEWHKTKNSKMIKTTTKIPMKLGTVFGVFYNLKGKPEGTEVKLRRVTTFPKQGLNNPKTGKTNYKDEFYLNKIIMNNSMTGYGFDNEWEMVPGTWTLQLWDGDNKILEQSFTVYKP